MEIHEYTGKKYKKKKIDAIDKGMIHLLQKNGRLTNTEIAKKLNVSEATIRTHLKRLLDEEYIQIVAVSNPFKLGFEITGDLYIHVDIDKIDGVLNELRKIKELWYIVTTTGNCNINAEFIVKSLEDLNELVYGKISNIDGIKGIESSVIMKFIKRDYNYGMAFD